MGERSGRSHQQAVLLEQSHWGEDVGSANGGVRVGDITPRVHGTAAWGGPQPQAHQQFNDPCGFRLDTALPHHLRRQPACSCNRQGDMREMGCTAPCRSLRRSVVQGGPAAAMGPGLARMTLGHCYGCVCACRISGWEMHMVRWHHLALHCSLGIVGGVLPGVLV